MCGQETELCSPRRRLCPSEEHGATSGDGCHTSGEEAGKTGTQGTWWVEAEGAAKHPQATGQPTAKSYPDQDARGVEGETLLCSLLLGVGVWLAGCVCWSWRGFRIRTNTLSTQNPGIRSDSWNGHPCSLPPPSRESEVNGIPAVQGALGTFRLWLLRCLPVSSGLGKAECQGTVSSLCHCPLSTS